MTKYNILMIQSNSLELEFEADSYQEAQEKAEEYLENIEYEDLINQCQKSHFELVDIEEGEEE